MKRNNFFVKTLTLFFILAFAFSLTSCGVQKKPIIRKSSTSEDEKEPPKELESIKGAIESVEKTLQGLYDKSKKPSILLQEEIKKQLEEEKKKSKENESSEEKKSDDEGSKKSEESPSPEEIQIKIEQDLYKTIEDLKKETIGLHSMWNTYEPKAVSDLANQSAITEFEATLNNLTKYINNRDVFQSLLNVNELYKNLPDFYMLYKTKTPPEIDRIRYAVKKIKLTSDVKDFASANTGVECLDTSWIVTKPKLKKDNVEIMNQFEFALADLKKAVETQDLMVIQAKSDVMLKIADEMEKASEKTSK